LLFNTPTSSTEALFHYRTTLGWPGPTSIPYLEASGRSPIPYVSLPRRPASPLYQIHHAAPLPISTPYPLLLHPLYHLRFTPGIQTHAADPAPTPARPVPWNNEVIRDHGSLQDEKRTWKLPFRPQTQTASIPTWTVEPNLGNMDHHAFPQFNTSPRREIRQTKNPPAVAKRLKSNKRFEHTGSQSLDRDTPPRVRPVRPPRPPGTTLRPPLDFVQPANRTCNGRTSRFTETIDSDTTNEPRNQALSARGENYSHEAPLESSDEHIETPPTPIRPRSPPPSTAAPASQTSATNSGGAPHRDALEHHLARIQALHDEWVEMVFLQGIQRSEDRRPRTTTPSSRPTGSPGHLKRSSTINTRSSSGEETSQGKPFSHDHSNYAKRGSPANRRADSGASDRAPVPHWRRPHSAPPLLGHKNPVDDPITPTTEGMEHSYLKYPAEHRGDSNTLGQQISHAGHTDGGNAHAQHIAQPPSPSPIPPDSPPAQEHGKRWSQRSLNEPDGTVGHMLDPRAFKFLKNLVSKKNKDKKGFVRLKNPSHSVSPPTSPPPLLLHHRPHPETTMSTLNSNHFCQTHHQQVYLSWAVVPHQFTSYPHPNHHQSKNWRNGTKSTLKNGTTTASTS